MESLPRPGFVLFYFHLLLGLGFMAWFSGMFGLTPPARLGLLAFHLTVSGLLWLAVFVTTGALLRTPLMARRHGLSFLVCLVPALLMSLIILLWVAEAINVKTSRLTLNFKLLAGALGQAGTLDTQLAPAAVWLTLLLASCAACGLHAWLAGPGLADWGQIPADYWRLSRPFSVTTRVFAGILLIANCWAAYLWIRRVRDDCCMYTGRIWRKEPLFSFVMQSLPMRGQPIFFPPTALRRRVAQQDAAERERYGYHSVPARNVILITVDALRADHLSVYGYSRQTSPFLARLQAEGRLRKVDEVRSACNCSQSGILSTLSSRDFEELGPGMFQIQDVLRSQGYKVYFILSGQHSTYLNLRELYGPNQDVYFDGDMATRFYRTDDRVLFEGLEQVPAQDANQPQPAFFYFHLMSAHEAGVRLPEYSPFQPAPAFMWNFLFEPVLPEIPINAYDNGVRMADATIERLFAELDRKHYLENSLVMILGDHGEELGEHKAWHHANGKPLYEQVLRIPLLIVDSPDAPYRNLKFALQLDVAPTILDRLSRPVPQSWRGRSLLQPDQPRVSYHHDTSEGTGRAVVLHEGSEEWKYLRSGLPGHEVEALYELHGDPGENKDRIDDPQAASWLNRLRDLAASRR